MFDNYKFNKKKQRILMHVEDMEIYIDRRLARMKCTKGEAESLSTFKTALKELKKELEG